MRGAILPFLNVFTAWCLIKLRIHLHDIYLVKKNEQKNTIKINIPLDTFHKRDFVLQKVGASMMYHCIPPEKQPHVCIFSFCCGIMCKCGS